MLTEVLARPQRVAGFDNSDWEQLLSEARHARLLARLWTTLEAEGVLMEPPQAFVDAALGAQIQSRFLQQRARYEIAELGALAAAADYPVVLLKGASYLMEGNRAVAGRSLSDIDVLVPRERLGDFEKRLDAAGWAQKDELSEYDNYYYRHYAHEIPPRWRPGFHFELDVHHNIIQPTHRYAVREDRLYAEIRKLSDTPFYVLSRRDQILHSATHLIMSDELRGGLRDVHDICLLYGEASAADAGFGEGLVARAEELGLQRALYYALDCARRHLEMDFPEPAWRRLAQAAPVAPIDGLMRYLIRHRLVSSADVPAAAWAERMLYIRSHWIRMPPSLLLRHLLKKALTGGGAATRAPVIPEGP